MKDPKGFSEKLMWIKLNLYNKDKLIWNCSDKFKVREHAIKSGVSIDNLPKLIGVYDRVDEINFEELPMKFALKCTHGCGFNVVCNDKSKLDYEECKKILKKWLKTKFGYASGETHYTHVVPKIICEEYIESSSDKLPIDYKLYCFFGEPKLLLTCSNRDKELKLNFYDFDWNELMYSKESFRNKLGVPKPKHLQEMIEISKKVSDPFPFVRVDFYEYKNKAILGEMTFTPAACVSHYYSELGNKELSKLLNIDELINKKN